VTSPTTTSPSTFIKMAKKYLPTGAALAGMILIFASIVFPLETEYARIVGATVGVLVLLIAVWYASHPIPLDKRKYMRLRTEFNKFKILVKDLHRAAVDQSSEDLAKTRAAMLASIDKMFEVAGRSD
jgi:hypothetical protein